MVTKPADIENENGSCSILAMTYISWILIVQWGKAADNTVLFKMYMSLVVRKPVFGVSDKVPHKPGCTATEDG